MHTSITLLVAALLWSGGSVAAATPPPSEFSFCAGIVGTTAPGSLYEIPLTEGIIKDSRAGLEDIRIFDGANKEVPFVVIGNVPPHESIETYPLEITGYDREAGTAVVVMRLPAKHRPIRVIDLDVADRDFKKRVRVLAGDGTNWSVLAEDSIFDFSSHVDVRKTRIEFPATDSRTFRIEIADVEAPTQQQTTIRLKYEGLDFSANAVQKKELRIRSMRGSTGTPAERHPVYDEHAVRPIATTADKDGNTVISIPAGLPLNRLSFDIADPYYSRTVQLYGSDSGKEDSYRLLTSQVIYRFPLTAERREERNVLEQNASKHAFYKVVLLNRNNPPLEISGLVLSWIQQNLYFIARKNGDRYTLCYGNGKVHRPDYDIVNFVNQNTLSQHAYARLDLLPAQAGSGAPVTMLDRLAAVEKPALRAIVVLLVIGMGIWLYTLMSRTGGKN